MSGCNAHVLISKDIEISTSVSDPEFHSTGLLLEEGEPLLVVLLDSISEGNAYVVVEGEQSFGELVETNRGVYFTPGAGVDGDPLTIETANGEPDAFTVRIYWFASSAGYTAQLYS